MKTTIGQWETSIAALWGRLDSLDRDEGIAAMRELAETCPSTDGRAAFELAGMYDTMGFEAEAGAEYERALALGLDDARHAQLAVQYGSTLRNLGRLEGGDGRPASRANARIDRLRTAHRAGSGSPQRRTQG